MSTTTTHPVYPARYSRQAASSGFFYVGDTQAERDEHCRRLGYGPTVRRGECERCGKRIWLSGMGIVSHRRACHTAMPAALVEYFRLPDWMGTDGRAYMPEAPVIRSVYRAGIGWTDLGDDLRTPTKARLQQLRDRGVTVVNIDYQGRVPDFRVTDLL